MKIDFRQGIVTHAESTIAGGQSFLQALVPGTVNIIGDVTVTFAQRTADYLHSELNTVAPAWTGVPTTGDVWLYWDIDTRTAEVTYGYTIVQPTSGNTQPTPVDDLHWFNTITKSMQVYSNNRFSEVIRVFAARINGTQLFPLGSNTKPYTGTQVGLNQPTNAGTILSSMGVPVIIGISGNIIPGTTISQLGSPLTATVTANPLARSGTYVFATTETEFVAGGSQKVTNIRLESDVVTSQANINMAAYDVVKFNSSGKIEPAGYNDTSTTTIGMILDNVSTNEIVSVLIQGKVRNENWNWATVGAELFISQNGELTESDPNIVTPSLYPVSKPPVARVLNSKELIFMQGLGKVGPRGLSPQTIGTIGDVTITPPVASGQILRYIGSPQMWRNTTLPDAENVLAITSVTDDYTILDSDRVIIADSTSNTVTITLPAVNTVPNFVFDIKWAAGAFAVTLTPAGAELIDDDASIVFPTLYNSVTVISDGTTWHIL